MSQPEVSASEISSPAAEADEAGQQAPLVLVVDDEPMVRQFIESYVEFLGYRAVGAGSAQEALTVFAGRRDQIGLALVDLTLPDMGGMDLVDHLAELDPAVRVMVTSGVSEDALEELLVHPNVRATLAKPFGGDTLSERMSQALR